MSFNVTRGVVHKPFFIILYGPPGVGKTTLATRAPNPIVLDLESGSHYIDCARVSVDSYERILDFAKWVVGEKEIKTVVIDSLTPIGALCEKHTFLKNEWTPEMKTKLGWKWWDLYRSEFRRFLSAILYMNGHGKNVITIGHSKIRDWDDPGQTDTARRFTFDIDKAMEIDFMAKSDACWHLGFKTHFIDGDKNRTVAKGTGIRELTTVPLASQAGKTRWPHIPDTIENPDGKIFETIYTTQGEKNV